MQLYVKKRNGKVEEFDKNKITLALFSTMESILDKNFSRNQDFFENISNKVKNEIFRIFKENDIIEISQIETIIEKELGKNGELELFRQYVLFSENKKISTEKNIEKIQKKIENETLKVTKKNGEKELFDIDKVKNTFLLASKGYKTKCKFSEIEEDFKKSLIDGINTYDIHKLLIKLSLDKITIQNSFWQNIAGRLALFDLYKKASINRKMKISQIYNKEKFIELINEYIENGLYYKDFYKYYTKEDFEIAASYLEKSRDWSYTYSIIQMYNKRYLLNPNKVIKELPQEMYMMSALFLAINEKPENRLKFALEIYDNTSNGKISLPTPTLLNARTNFHQLSSCFKFNIDDDLRAIYHSIENMAQVSKFGGGIGVYLGNIRSRGGTIRGVKGASGGVNPWIKVINDTAIAVNQLGSRAGAISVTLDAFHRDIYSFLDLQTETGDIRSKAFDIFPAVSFPDLFMERVANNENWSLFDPKEISDKTGKKLQDHFGAEFEKFYIECENNNNLELKEIVSARDLFKKYLKATVETGMPYAFFRDTVNAANPNKHAGNIYSTQLCVTGDTRIHSEKGLKKIGDLYKEYKEIPLKCTVDNRTDGEFLSQGIRIEDTIGIYKTAENADVYEITTNEGFKIKTTQWHKFYKAELNKGNKRANGRVRINYEKTKIEKVEMKDLIVGDNLLLQSGEGQFGEKGSKELGILTGLIVGDGTFSKDLRNNDQKWKAHIELYNKDMDLKNLVGEALEKVIKEYSNKNLFKINYEERKISNNHKINQHTENSQKIRISSSRLGQILDKELNLNGSNKLKQVSEFIFEGNKEMIIGFLQGIFTADGHIHNKKRNGEIQNFGIRMSSISKQLLEDIQLLLINLGIRSKVYKMRDARIGVFTHTKKDGTIVQSKTKGNFRLIMDGFNSRLFHEKIGFIGHKNETINNLLKKLETLENSGKFYKEYYIAKIKEIKYIGKEDVYDTTQDNNNSLIFNGIVTGNCVEINQNTSVSKFIEETTENGIIVIKYEPGDSVVCNLASINVAKVNTQEEIEKIIPIAMRLLDNVIDLNFYPVKETELTAKKYRSVGLGFLGLAEYLAVNKLAYDSKEARDVVDKLFEKYAYQTLKSSNELAKERGTYKVYEGSEWSKGILLGKDSEWFAKNSEMNDKWQELLKSIKDYGMRFAYHLAPAPNTSCQSGNNKMITHDGIKTIYEILKEQGFDYNEIEKKEPHWIELKSKISVPTFEGDDLVEKIWYNGYQDVKEIEFEDGKKYQFTNNHKLLVKRNGQKEWVRVDQLKEGDDILNINQ